MTEAEARRRLGLDAAMHEEAILEARARLVERAQEMPKGMHDAFVARLDEATQTLIGNLHASEPPNSVVSSNRGLLASVLLGGFKQSLAMAINSDPATRENVVARVHSEGFPSDAREELMHWLDGDTGKSSLLDRVKRAIEAAIRLGPLVLIVAAFVGGFLWAPKSAGSDYFVAAAGVIPVLLLALAIETRILRLQWLVRFAPKRFLPKGLYQYAVRTATESEHKAAARYVRLSQGLDTIYSWYRAGLDAATTVLLAAAVAVMLILSEWNCMHTLASMAGDDRRDPSLVSAGILAGLVGVAVVALLGGSER